MTRVWLGWCEPEQRRELLRGLHALAPGALLTFADSAANLRERFRDEEPGMVGAIVATAAGDVSGINLAAAVVRDGRASEVVLVAEAVDASLSERARQAGIARVIDRSSASEASQNVPAHVDADAKEARSRDARTIDERVPEVEAKPVVAPSGTDTHTEHAARPRRLSARRDIGSRGPILVLASGRGGVGKTTLAALAAQVASSWDMNVALVDLDLSCGNLYSCFGVMRGADLARMVREGEPAPDVVARTCVRCSEHLSLWGPCERPEMAELVMPHVGTLLEQLSQRFDLVVVDTSTTFTDGVAQAVQACDRLLLVHDERGGAIASLSRMSSLAVRLGVARTRIVRIANLCDPRVQHSLMEGRAEVGLETARIYRVPDGGYETEELMAAGKVAELTAGQSDVTGACASMLAQVLSELGKLPESPGAQEALGQQERRRRFSLFGRRREAV